MTISTDVSKSFAEKCWPIIFPIGDNLGIRNLLHILEICLVPLFSIAESERVFSLLWHIFSKERQSLKHGTLELLSGITLDNDQSKEWNADGDAVEMFLKEYPDGRIRKKNCHLQGHIYPSNWASLKKHCHNAASALLNVSSDKESEEQINAPENLPLKGISDDEWSSDNE